MSKLEVLKATQAKIADPSKWCFGATARTADGFRVNATSEEACRWCTAGAMEVVAKEVALNHDYSEDDFRESFAILDEVARGLGFNSAVHLNDYTRMPSEALKEPVRISHARVMLMFNVAIQYVESRDKKRHDLNPVSI